MTPAENPQSPIPRKTIGIDFDDVVYNLADDLREFINQKYGTAFKRDEQHEYYMGFLWGLDKITEEAFVNEFCATDMHHHGPAIDGAIEGVKALAQHHDLVIVTARGDDRAEITHRWIDKNLPGIFRDIVFTNPHHEIVERRKKKSHICADLRIDYFIDDHYKNILDVSPCVKTAFLLDTPWNAIESIKKEMTKQGIEIPDGVLPANVERVFSWDEIVRRINESAII